MSYRNLIDWNAYLAEETEIEALADQEESAVREKCWKRSTKRLWITMRTSMRTIIRNIVEL